jgi:hypothetical protein
MRIENHDYLNDPRLDEFKDHPLPAREVYAWRLAVQDEKRGMSPEQAEAYYEEARKETEAFCALRGIRLKCAEGAAAPAIAHAAAHAIAPAIAPATPR